MQSVCRSLFALIVVVGAGCGSVAAPKADAGTGDAAQPDANEGGCTPNAFSCGANDALMQCDAEGAGEVKVQDCQYGCTGNACNECSPNTMFCSADDLVSCDASGKIVNPQACANGCQMDRCNTCKPGIAFCSSGNAVACAADGTPGVTTNCGGAGCQGGVCNSCTPNTTSCQGDKLVMCNANGSIASTTDCALGCSTTNGAHCKVMTPSYGVGLPSGSLPALAVTDNATLDITNCPTSAKLTIGTTETVINGSPQLSQKTQSGGPPICIVRFGSINVASTFTLTIVNNASPGHVVSLQSVGDVSVAGTITFTNLATGPSPGGSVSVIGPTADNADKYGPGGGGAGGARAGGAGGKWSTTNGGGGGAAVTTILTLLTGGSFGGNVVDGTTNTGIGGNGGGGLQIVSLTKVTVAATGRLAVNGTGGRGTGFLANVDMPAGGGGSGGTLVIEAPAISMSAGAVAAANGGGGAGGCYSCTLIDLGGGQQIKKCVHHNGQPGQLSATRAAGGDCNGGGGDGGYEANGMTLPSAIGETWSTNTHAAGGGGGSDGFILLRARAAGNVTITSGAVVSPATTPGAVTAN
jgi:hypothetical protein